MVRKLIEIALNNPLVVVLLTLALGGYGTYAFLHVNVEAYPDPAPAIIEIVAQFPGASAEEVERQVTIPLEVTLAGIPGLKYTRSKSLFGLAHLRNQFEYGVDYEKARQEVINRLQFTQPLPPGVTPQLSPQSPTGEIFRYTLNSPRDSSGREIYTLNDLKALQDWVLEREFRRVPRIIDVSSSGGTVKRYEIHPDPDRLKSFGITLGQLQAALLNANANVGGDYVIQGHVAMSVRSVGLFGGGQDPAQQVAGYDKQALEAYRDACLAQVLHLVDIEHKRDIWPILAEHRINGAAASAVTENDKKVAVIERLLHAADGQEVSPPLSEPEQQQVDTLRRLRAAVAGQPVRAALRPDEQEQVDSVKRIIAAHSPGEGEMPLGQEERGQADAIRRWAATRAAARLREEDDDRIREIRKLVVTSINNKDILVEDLVEGGRLGESETPGKRGVVVGHQTRLGRVGLNKAYQVLTPTGIHRVANADGKVLWRNESDKIQCIVLLRKGEDSLPALDGVRKKVEELNSPETGRMLPGVKIEPYYDRTELINVTTETVKENLAVGITLVILILFMFVSNVRMAIIVALNIPLALLFAFSVLFLRGKSANLLSIGAVDFGIIVDSSVIMVENVYRHLSTGEHAELPLKERILRSAREIDRALLFSTAIMVCAFIPLFTMRGPEGQLFGPMADTYAFALGGALILAVTLTPVLCLFLFKKFKPVADNFLVTFMRSRYLRQLDICLKYRWTTLVVMGSLIVGTVGYIVVADQLVEQGYDIPHLGREFMPQLEEGNLWIRGTFPLNVSLDRVADDAEKARAILSSYAEVEAVVLMIGRPDDGTDPTGFYNVEIFAPLRPQKEWPHEVTQTGWQSHVFGKTRSRTKEELVNEMNAELSRKLVGVDWNFSQNIRDNVMEALSGIKGDNSVKIIGPDLEELERLADRVKNALRTVKGIENVGVFSIKGQTNLEFRIDLDKCKRWGVSAADVNNVVQTALGGKAFATMIEGEKMFDVTIRWPAWRRGSETSILDIPVDIANNQVLLATGPGVNPSPTGSGQLSPAKGGSLIDTTNPITNTPRILLRDLVSPVGKNGKPDPKGSFERAGASTIYREQGKRLIAVKFSVRGRDLAGAVADAREKTKEIVQSPYRMVWSGEFEEMEEAEARLMLIIPLSLGLIFVLLYMAFRSLLDTLIILSNVLALLMGGLWALLLTNTNFSISAAVGFVSLFGVAIMDGLLLVSSFNANRAHGMPLHDAIMQGASKRVRAVIMTALTAILGLLPAALSTRIGAQTQKPLAIVVVGGMITTLFLTRYLMPVLYSFYGHREPPAGSGDLAH